MRKIIKAGFKKFVEFSIWIYYVIVHRIKVEGRENIPKEGALVFCGNHRSYLDAPLIRVTAKRETFFLAKASLYRHKFLAFMGWVFEVIPVKKDDNDINAIKASLKHLKNGECIALFPEGTRNGIEKGEKVKDGAAFFAIRTGAKVIPIGISGTMKKFCKLKIKYGKPLDFSSYDKNDQEALAKATNEIMENIFSLVEKWEMRNGDGSHFSFFD